jgi:signal transduction histidine kinase
LIRLSKNNNLSYRLLFLILMCSSVFTLLGTAIQLYMDYREDVQKIENGFQQIRESFIQPLAVSLWNFDKEQLQIQVKGMISLPDMRYVEIREKRGDQDVTILVMGKPETGESISHQFLLEYEKETSNIRVGSLLVTASLTDVYNRIRAKVLLVLVTQAVKTFFVSVLILLIFHFLIMKHLNVVALHMKEIGLDRLKNPLQLKRKENVRKEPDLLDDVVDSINGMQTRLVNDFTAKEAAEHALRISQERYRRLFEFSPVSIWHFDLSAVESKLHKIKESGVEILDEHLARYPQLLDELMLSIKIIDINGTTLGIFDAGTRQQLTERFPEIFLDSNRSVYHQLIQAIWQNKEYFELDFKGVTMNGRPLFAFLQWFISSESAQMNPSESILAVTDITERKKMEEILVQSEKMASLGGLAAGMAHELNNPLGIMLQASQNIERRTSTDLRKNLEVAADLDIEMNKLRTYMDQRGILRYIDEIRESGIRAARIIKNMLQFGRKSNSESVELNINSVLEKSIELAGNDYDLKRKYDFKNINIIREYSSNIKEIPIVETEVEQVFLNLLKNAAQAFSEADTNRPPEILVKTEAEEGMIQIEISDNGPGMDEKTCKRIFEPFFSTKPVGKGTGLGLSISYMIITNNHNGTMAVESEPGKGTRFLIRLPFG